MKPSDPMDPSGPHDVFQRLSLEHFPHVQVDHTLSTAVLTSLAVNSTIALAVADTAVRLLSSALITVVTSLIVGWISRRIAMAAVRAEVLRAEGLRASLVPPAPTPSAPPSAPPSLPRVDPPPPP